MEISKSNSFTFLLEIKQNMADFYKGLQIISSRNLPSELWT